MAYRCIPRKAELAGSSSGYSGRPTSTNRPDKSYYFLDAKSTLDKPRWVQYCTQKHDRDSTVVNEKDATPLAFEPTDKTTLWNQLSLLRYSEPFFYGRFGNMVLIYIFEPNPGLRFSHSPSGGGDTRAKDGANPAWDFPVGRAELRGQQGIRPEMRLVYKPWVDRADVLREVRAYLGR